MTTLNIERSKRHLMDTDPDFIPNDNTFSYGTWFVIGWSSGSHVLARDYGGWVEHSMAKIGLLTDLDNEASKQHKPVTAVPDDYEPPF